MKGRTCSCCGVRKVHEASVTRAKLCICSKCYDEPEARAKAWARVRGVGAGKAAAAIAGALGALPLDVEAAVMSLEEQGTMLTSVADDGAGGEATRAQAEEMVTRLRRAEERVRGAAMRILASLPDDGGS